MVAVKGRQTKTILVVVEDTSMAAISTARVDAKTQLEELNQKVGAHAQKQFHRLDSPRAWRVKRAPRNAIPSSGKAVLADRVLSQKEISISF